MNALVGTSTLLATATPIAAVAGPMQVDPAFAVIEGYRRAWAGLDEVVAEQSKLEQELPKDQRQSDINAFEETIVESDDPRWIESERAVDAAHDAVSEAEDQFVELCVNLGDDG